MFWRNHAAENPRKQQYTMPWLHVIDTQADNIERCPTAHEKTASKAVFNWSE
jgi:hypothetical protein